MNGDLIVFDLDGVLIDSRLANYEAFRYGLLAAGCPEPEPTTVAALIGLPPVTMFERLGCPSHCSQAFYDSHVQPHYVDNLDSFARPYPQARQVLETLKGLGYRLAACTSGDEKTQHRVLTSIGLRDMLEVLHTPCRSAFRKPDPRYLAEVVDHFPPKGSVLHVEDTEIGLQMGRAFGAVTFFASYGYGTHGEVTPDHRLEQLTDLVELVGANAALC